MKHWNMKIWLKYGISFPYNSKTINSIIMKFSVLLPDGRSYNLKYQSQLCMMI